MLPNASSFLLFLPVFHWIPNPSNPHSENEHGICILVEENTWGDSFWGTVNGRGENQLGQILMDVRAKLRWDVEISKVLAC